MTRIGADQAVVDARSGRSVVMAPSLVNAELRAIVAELQRILVPLEPRWAGAMQQLTSRLDAGSLTTHEAAREVLQFYRGLGSFNDVVLQDRDGVRPEQFEFDRLRDRLFELSRDLLGPPLPDRP